MAASRARGQGVAIDLCPRCRKEILPREPGPQLRGVHRGKIVEPKPDPRAERKRMERERKRAKRAGLQRPDHRRGVSGVLAHGAIGAAKLYIQTVPETLTPVDEECAECLRRQGKAA